MSNNYFNGIYEQFIYKSRYARYIENAKRREEWPETINRYFNFFEEWMKDNKNFDITPFRNELEEAVLDMKVMPSMRGLMTAGPALKRDEASLYNCAYLPIDSLKSFDEQIYTLMLGTGVGFSVETYNTDSIPQLPESFHKTDTVIVFEDSRIGWAKGFREYLALLMSGQIPKHDVSKLRPKGARLKTFGGRSSGPEPLVELLDFTRHVFVKAAGRKLTSLECHDIACKIADIVVVGGVRRSALISLTDLSDDRMRDAKSGAWYNTHPHRRLSNNSAVYEERPESGVFMREWLALYESKSGERGIFSRKAAKFVIEKANEFRRKHFGDEVRVRDINHRFGSNPCITKDMMIDTSEGLRSVESLIDNPFKAIVDGKEYNATGFWKTGDKEVFRLVTDRGYEIRATSNHEILTASGDWVPLGKLQIGDSVCINNTRRDIDIHDQTEFNHGWIVGEVVGDGCFNQEKYRGVARFWGPTAKHMSDIAFDIIEAMPTTYNQPIKPKAPVFVESRGIYEVTSKKNDLLCEGMIDNQKNVLPSLEQRSPSFIAGFLRGLFDADSCVGGNTKGKGAYIQLTQIKKETLLSVQRMLSVFGIVSTVLDRNAAPTSMLPNGKGGYSEYECQPIYRLDLSRDNLELFDRYIGYHEPEKAERLKGIIQGKSRQPYRSRFETKVVEIISEGVEEVFDCTVDDVHRFGANGIVVHNCSEIILRPYEFCNLTSVQVRETDTFETLKKKVRLATIIGTMQACLSNFRYLSKKWQRNCEDERLLGVSLNGVFDNSIMNGKNGQNELIETLEELRKVAIATNIEWAGKFGINVAAAITCIKPEGCLSLDTKIKTSEGILSMAELAVSLSLENIFEQEGGTWLDVEKEIFVFDENNELQPIEKLYVNGFSTVFEVEMEDGTVVKMTPNHHVKTKDGWKKASELSEGDDIISF